MNFKTNFQAIENDLSEVIRSFSEFDDNAEITHSFLQQDGKIYNTISINGKVFEYVDVDPSINSFEDIEKLRLIKRDIKLAMYKAMVEFTHSSHAWGSLMGIRPVKLYKSLIEREKLDAFKYFLDYYLVSEEKTKLVDSVYNFQKPYFATENKPLNLYIGIPFCVSRCYYCSFISADLRATKQELVEEYCDALIQDIKNAKDVIKKYGYNLRNVYMGGGTPTALNEKQLAKVLDVCDFDVPEFTIEAGRPDTITKEKLDTISKYANRISVNPQTLNDETLKKIGRNHSIDDFYRIYDLASKYDFEINCDLIAGLMDEKVEDFDKSISGIIALNPENITTHTLALKAGSKLRESVDKNINDEITGMLKIGYERLKTANYVPYYLYRQKYMAGNLENTGFCKTTPCVYNIDIMEENTSNIACGSYGISKRFYPLENRIERFAHPKDVRTYIDKLSQNLIKREELLR
ncbi:MAG: coproporphyrinogen dehydrogenase HemZ [Clostridia bacterium]